MSVDVLDLVSILVAAVAVFGVFAVYFYRMSAIKTEYRLDKLRLDVEREIYDLTTRLQSSGDRFASVNHLLLDAQRAALASDAPLGVLQTFGIVPKPIDQKQILVLTPFNPLFDEDWKATKSSLERIGLRAVRGDEEFHSRDILKHVLELMISSRLVIANITGRNPNVFYELGIAHAMGKQVLLIAQSPEDIPFDVSSVRTFFYGTPELLENLLGTWVMHSLLHADANAPGGTTR